MLEDLKRKILNKKMKGSLFIDLSLIAKILGYSRSDLIYYRAVELGLNPVRIGKKYKLHIAELDKLLIGLMDNR